MILNNKKIDINTLVVENVDPSDFPDFCDACFSDGYYEDGAQLTDDELQKLGEDYPEILWEMAHESLF